MLDGCCCYTGGDVELPALITITMRKARKEHKCYECGDTILPGDLYENVRGLWDGAWSEYKTCRVCTAIRRDFCCDGFIYGTLWETLHECLVDLSEDDDGKWLR